MSGKGVYIDDQNTPQLINLNEDPLMTECLVYFLASGTTVMGSSVDEQDSDDGSNGPLPPTRTSSHAACSRAILQSLERDRVRRAGRRASPPRQGRSCVHMPKTPGSDANALWRTPLLGTQRPRPGALTVG